MQRSFDQNKLTKRQQELLDYLREFQRDEGLMPSTREIQKHFGFASQTAAMSHLRALERKGVIRRLPGKARAVVIAGAAPRGEVREIPVYGAIPAGLPVDSEQHSDDTLVMDLSGLGVSRTDRTFALKVTGDSMVDAHILDGDTVILEAREPNHRDIVAALIDSETTLKRFLVHDGTPYLKAENPRYPDLLPAHELIVQGVMVGLVRRGA